MMRFAATDFDQSLQGLAALGIAMYASVGLPGAKDKQAAIDLAKAQAEDLVWVVEAAVTEGYARDLRLIQGWLQAYRQTRADHYLEAIDDRLALMFRGQEQND